MDFLSTFLSQFGLALIALLTLSRLRYTIYVGSLAVVISEIASIHASEIQTSHIDPSYVWI